MLLDIHFWTPGFMGENHKQIVTRKEWKEICQKEGIRHIVNGKMREFKIHSLGAGMYEIYTIPMK